jgi:hypothetical protein
MNYPNLLCQKCGVVLTYDMLEQKLHPSITIGPYTIAPAEEGKLWIHHASGESGRFDAAKLEAMIADFFNREF